MRKVNRHITILVAVVSALLSWFYMARERHIEYNNPDVGLSFTYSDEWQTLKDNQFAEALDTAEDLNVFTDDTVATTKEMSDLFIFSIVRPRKMGDVSQNATITILTIPVSEDEYDTIDLKQIRREQIEEIESSSPSVATALDAYPLTNYPNVLNYLTKMSLGARTITQYQFMYWHEPYIVMLSFAFTHPDDEMELRDIINTMKIW